MKGRRRLRELLEASEQRDVRPGDYRDHLKWFEGYLDRRETEIEALKAALREYGFFEEDR